MRAQIDKIKRDIQIHKEVEKELAKRSHFCQKVIKKLKNQVETLEAERGQVQNNPGEVHFMDEKPNSDEELINFLE
jgi:hypothetical protein